MILAVRKEFIPHVNGGSYVIVEMGYFKRGEVPAGWEPVQFK